MTDYTEPDELWARPSGDVLINGHHLLRTHSGVVSDRMAEAIDGCQLSVAAGREAEFCQVIGYCHDFGKLTEWFQQLIRGKGNVRRGDPLTYHSLLGAMLCMFALKQRGFDPVEQAFGGIVVMAHHSPMPDPASRAEYHMRLPRDPNKQNPLTETYERLDRQLKNIIDRVPDQAAQMIDQATDGAGSLEEFEQYVDDRAPVRTLDQSQLSKPGGAPSGFYADVLLVYSALKFADTSHSASAVDSELFVDGGLDRSKLTQKLASFDEKSGVKGDLNDLRDEAQDTVVERTGLLCGPDAPSVASIWLPTGFGKTFAGLRAALELTERRDTDTDRIVYALPFTSIIDQTAETIEDVFGVNPGSPNFIIHHYLSEAAKAVSRDSDMIEQPVDSSIEYLLGGSWRAGCVLTTFVQLFESVIAPTGSQAPKVPAIRDSVIILDEPQELPPRLWPLLARVIEMFVDRFNAHVIFMTATRPRFFEYHSDQNVVDLIDDPSPYVDLLRRNSRVRYRLHESARRYIEASDEVCDEELPLTHPDAAMMICDGLGGDVRSVLAVCNTVSSSRELYGAARETFAERGRAVISPALVFDRLLRRDDEIPTAEAVINAVRAEVDDDTVNADGAENTEPVIMLNLTARHRPPDRQVLIDTLTGLLNAELDARIVITSTRLIEAGVDISLDRVYRDIAQVTSIVQSGGRCNREFDSSKGECGGVVTVWRLGQVEEATNQQIKYGRTPASQIYGTGASGEGGMAQTRAALRGRGTEINEGTMITDVIREFFAAMHQYGHGDQDLADAIDRVDIEELSGIQLIDEQVWLTDTIVTRTTTEKTAADNLRDEFRKLPGERDQAKRKRLLKELDPIRYPVPIPTDDDDTLIKSSGFITMTDGNDLLWLDSSAEEFDPDLGVRRE